MTKRIAATDAKNNFGGLLDDVAALGCVEIVKHGRLVAMLLSPRAFEEARMASSARGQHGLWGESHMIPPQSARAARMLSVPSGFDEG